MKRQGERGNVMIETSLSLLLLLLLTLGIVDCGRYLYAANLLPYLAREGARFASLRGVDVPPEAVRDHVRRLVAGLPPGSVDVTLTVDHQTPAVTVQTRWTFAPATGVVLGQSVPVTGQARLTLPAPSVAISR